MGFKVELGQGGPWWEGEAQRGAIEHGTTVVWPIKFGGLFSAFVSFINVKNKRIKFNHHGSLNPSSLTI